MLSDDDRARARAAARAARIDQGLGDTIDDERALAKIAVLLAAASRNGDDDRSPGRPGPPGRETPPA